jgi:hypothetical protein
MELWQIENIFVVPILSIIGFIFNLLSTIVFSLIVKNGQRGDDMYKHLLLKSICQMLGCFFSVFYAVYYYMGPLTYIYLMAFWNIWFENFIIKALFMASTGFEIAATFNCVISIEKQMKWCEKRLSFWIWVLFILILSFGVEVFPVFMLNIFDSIEIDKFNRTIHSYSPLYNSLVLKFGIYGLSESIIKEVLFLLILLSLNCYILFKLIQIGRRKKRLNTNSSNVQNSARAENRKIVMIIVLFLTFLLGHLPNFMFFAVSNGYGSNFFWVDFKDFAFMCLYLSYSTSFFVYLAFNNIFRRLFMKIIPFTFNFK